MNDKDYDTGRDSFAKPKVGNPVNLQSNGFDEYFSNSRDFDREEPNEQDYEFLDQSIVERFNRAAQSVQSSKSSVRSPQERASKAYPPQERAAKAYPAQERASKAYPAQERVSKAYSAQERASKAYPAQERASKAYPAQERASKAYPAQERASKAYPPQERASRAHTPNPQVSVGSDYNRTSLKKQPLSSSSLRQPPPVRKKNERHMNPALIALIDILLTGLALVVFSLFHHVFPQELKGEGIIAVNAPHSSASKQPDGAHTGGDALDNLTGSSTGDVGQSAEADTWKERFKDKFTNEVVVTDKSYSSPNVSITVEKYEDYGAVYYVQDIYISDISCFQTAFAKDKYGKGYEESIPAMAERYNALAAVNGDYYGIGTSGTVIRNGVLYRRDEGEEMFVLYKDGTVAYFPENSYDAEEVLNDGAWQSWSFGPNLLDENSKSMTEFKSRLKPKNPRTVLGYYEPGHYCFVLVDGRQEGYSDGLTLSELSSVMEKLGCAAAYNLDGGQSSMMTFMDDITDRPYNGGRNVSDILLIAEPASDQQQ